MPIMATSFIQMAYSLTDMAWVGRLGSESVAAVGAVGILTWMSGSIALLNKVGAEVSVGQSIGARSEEDARSFASHNITIALLISVCWGGQHHPVKGKQHDDGPQGQQHVGDGAAHRSAAAGGKLHLLVIGMGIHSAASSQ